MGVAGKQMANVHGLVNSSDSLLGAQRHRWCFCNRVVLAFPRCCTRLEMQQGVLHQMASATTCSPFLRCLCVARCIPHRKLLHWLRFEVYVDGVGLRSSRLWLCMVFRDKFHAFA